MNKIESPAESRKLLDKIMVDLTRSIVKKDELTRFWFFILIMFIVVGVWGWIIQIRTGLGVTGMRDYVSWGMYIANFVFFVAVSLIGFLISSALALLKINWAKPISRVAEQVAIAAVALAGLIIIMDMGRPDRFLNIFLHGRFASPIIWDVTVVTTYLAISVLLFYVPLIPDLALMRDRMDGIIPKWKMNIYTMLALGWKGDAEQYKVVYHALRVLMLLIIPVGLSIHTVTSWLFAANCFNVCIPRAIRTKRVFSAYSLRLHGKTAGFCLPCLPLFQHQRIPGSGLQNEVERRHSPSRAFCWQFLSNVLACANYRAFASHRFAAFWLFPKAAAHCNNFGGSNDFGMVQTLHHCNSNTRTPVFACAKRTRLF